MSHWNYRLTVQTCDDVSLWEVREIYYADDGSVTSWSKDPITASGESWLECADDLSRMAGVISLPAFDLDAQAWCDRKRRPQEAK
jgi:hypothetical protein